MNKIVIAFLLFFAGNTSAQTKKFIGHNVVISNLVEGILITPDTTKSSPLVILIGGSGPVDRNGNQIMTKNNSLKFLAEGLYDLGISSFRYDKRLVKMMQRGSVDENKIRLDDFVDDAILVIDFFKANSKFSELIIIGHSQGSLVGMIAAQNRVNKFISIAGAGQQIDDVIVDQLAQQAPGLEENARQSFDDLRANGVAQNYSSGLASIFRPAIQPFILSWMQYDPQAEIAQLNIPVLIINGDKDLQVQVSEAELLAAAKPDAQLVIIPFMNHIFKRIEGDDLENQKSYNEYNLPIEPMLLDIIGNFILN